MALQLQKCERGWGWGGYRRGTEYVFLVIAAAAVLCESQPAREMLLVMGVLQ